MAGDFDTPAPTTFELQNGYPLDRIDYAKRVLEHHEFMRRLEVSIQELTAIADYPGRRNECESNEAMRHACNPVQSTGRGAFGPDGEWGG